MPSISSILILDCVKIYYNRVFFIAHNILEFVYECFSPYCQHTVSSHFPKANEQWWSRLSDAHAHEPYISKRASVICTLDEAHLNKNTRNEASCFSVL